MACKYVARMVRSQGVYQNCITDIMAEQEQPARGKETMRNVGTIHSKSNTSTRIHSWFVNMQMPTHVSFQTKCWHGLVA